MSPLPKSPAAVVLLVLLLLALALAACGEKSEDGTTETQDVSLTLDFYPNPDHAGIYMAEKLGYFEEAGLDVSIATPSDPSLPLKQVAARRADLAISYEPEVILANEQGLDAVAVAAIVNEPLTSMFWLKKSDVKGVADLKGKTVAYAGIPYQEAFMETILAEADLKLSDVKLVNVGFNLLPALAGGSAQAMLGGFRNVEGVDLEQRGREPVVTPVDQLGVPTYDELVLVANPEELEADPEKFRLFIAAVERGTAAAVENPGAATKAILEANRDLDPKLTRAEIEATLPLLGVETPGRPYGYMDPKAWESFAGWMRDNELIEALPRSEELLSNDYLPGEIPE